MNQTIAYKNSNLEFVDFTDNLLSVAGVKNEDSILGKRDDGDLPWSMYADEYQSHDRDALQNNSYATLVPFCGADPNIKGPVLCVRSPCVLGGGEPGIFIHVTALYSAHLDNFINILKKTEPANFQTSYFIGKNLNDIVLSNRESECLFF